MHTEATKAYNKRFLYDFLSVPSINGSSKCWSSQQMKVLNVGHIALKLDIWTTMFSFWFDTGLFKQ